MLSDLWIDIDPDMVFERILDTEPRSPPDTSLLPESMCAEIHIKGNPGVGKKVFPKMCFKENQDRKYIEGFCADIGGTVWPQGRGGTDVHLIGIISQAGLDGKPIFDKIPVVDTKTPVLFELIMCGPRTHICKPRRGHQVIMDTQFVPGLRLEPCSCLAANEQE